MAEIDPVILELRADVDRYQADLRNSTRTVDQQLGLQERRVDSFGKRFGGGLSLAKGAVVAFAAAVGVDAITGAISRALEYASSLGEVAQQLGVSTDALQEYRFAATQAGLAQEEIDQALSQLTRRIGEAASGTKAQAEAFEALGISVRDAEGNILQAGDAIPQIADALKRVESPAARAALLLDLFGRSGQKLEPLLAGGAAGVNNLRDAARELGIVLSSQQIQSADDAADKLAAVKQVLEARLAGVVADNADEIVALADALATLAEKAIRAAAALTRFFSENSKRQNDLATITKAVEGTTRGTPSQKAAASARARQNYYDQNGFQTNRLDPFGIFTVRSKANFAGEGLNLGQSTLDRSLSGAQGVGSISIDRLLGDGTAPAAVAMTENLNSMSVELQRLTADLAIATADLTGSIQARADAEKQRVDADLAGEVERLKADTELDAVERDNRIALLRQTAAVQKAAVADAALADLAEQRARAEEDVFVQRIEGLRDDARTLDAQSRIALTLDARREIEERLLAVTQEEERQRLEAAIAAGAIADAAKARANLATRQEAERTGLAQGLASPLQRFAQGTKDTETLVEEAAVRRIEELNQTIADAMTNALGIKDPFLSQLIKIFLDKNVFGPLAEGLSGAGGGGALGGIISAAGSFLGGLFGRSSGGAVSAGRAYRVNEGAPAGRVEAFIPNNSGQIIPLGQMNAMQAGGSGSGGILKVVIEEGPGFAARVRTEAVGVSVEVFRAGAPQIIDAAANETLNRASRPRL
jgi:hypothetical protein